MQDNCQKSCGWCGTGKQLIFKKIGVKLKTPTLTWSNSSFLYKVELS